MSLAKNNRAVLRAADRAAVALALKGAQRFAKDGRWLGKGNRYADDTVGRLKRDLASQNINGRHLSQYIAVSTLQHAVDGWSYLGRSFQSMLQGDPNRALHMAYYAELRASMSLLACCGVGVFNDRHMAVVAENTTKVFGQRAGTHLFAWDALSYWSERPNSGDHFANVVRPYGRSLDDWLKPVGGGVTLLPKTKSWFRQWGMDIKKLGQDRESRNLRSYRPNAIPEPWVLEAPRAAEFVSETWGLLEPSTSSFESLDKHILRLSLESLFRGLYDTDASAADHRFVSMVDNVVSAQGMPTMVAKEWADFLTRAAFPENPLVLTYSSAAPSEGSADAYGVASRATLLLRIATGMTNSLFEDAGVEPGNLDFWREQIGVSRGFWPTGSRPNALADLWSDIDATAVDVQSFFSITPLDQQDFKNLSIELAPAMFPFGSCERVALWGVLASA